MSPLVYVLLYTEYNLLIVRREPGGTEHVQYRGQVCRFISIQMVNT